MSSLAFLDHLTLVSVSQEQAVLAPQPGYEDAARFARSPTRTERIRSELADLLGRRMQIVVQSEAASASQSPLAEASSQPTDTEQNDPIHPPTSDSGPHGTKQQQLADALNLPLVQEVMEAFPDARPVDVRPETEESNTRVDTE